MNQKNLKKLKSKEEALTIAEKLYNNREKVIKAFENKAFPFSNGFQKKESGMSDKSLPVSTIILETGNFDKNDLFCMYFAKILKRSTEQLFRKKLLDD